jgi:hypothetical protein
MRSAAVKYMMAGMVARGQDINMIFRQAISGRNAKKTAEIFDSEVKLRYLARPVVRG